MAVNIMKRSSFYFLGFLVAVLTATASKLSDFELRLDAGSEVTVEMLPVVAQDSCAIPDLTLVETTDAFPDNKQEP